MSKQDEKRFPLRLDDLTRWKVEYWYKRDDCQSRNEFVARAVNFYADYLEGLENSVLPPAIQSAIDGRLGMFEDRVFIFCIVRKKLVADAIQASEG